MADCLKNITRLDFIDQFHEFANDDNIETMLHRAMCFIMPFEAMCCCRQLAIFLMTAHLLTLQNNIKNGDTAGGLQGGASIDKVSVTVIPPPFTDSFDYWLNQTLYGAELLALMDAKMPSPQYFGGSNIRVLG